jgi:hypothetical protein
MLNATEREFIPLTDVTVEQLDGDEAFECDFMVLARSKIVFVLPISE